MSLSLIVQTKDNLFIGADSALSSVIQGDIKRVGSGFNKVRHIKDYVVYCSGSLKYSMLMFEKIEHDILNNDLHLESISEFAKNNIKQKEINLVNLEVIIANKCSSMFYHIADYNNFDIVEVKYKDSISVYSVGYNSNKAIDFASELLDNNTILKKVYEKTFTYMSSNAIGGKLKVYNISNNSIEKYFDYNIDNLYDCELNGLKTINLISAPLLAGRILAGNNLRIENSANQFLLDENGAVLTNASFTLTTTNGKGKIILDPDTGIKIQGNSTGSFVDKFYVDTSGNVIFSGNLSGASGTFSGTVSAATIIGSSITGGSISGSSININNKFIVDSSGNMTANDVDISGDISGSNISGSSFTGGSIDIGSNFSVDSSGFLVASGVFISGDSSFNVSGATSMILNSDSSATFSGDSGASLQSTGGNVNITSFNGDVLIQSGDDVEFTVDDLFKVTATDITMNAFDDLNLNGDVRINGDRIPSQSDLDDRYCQNESSQNMSFQKFGSTLEVFVNGSYEGSLTFD